MIKSMMNQQRKKRKIIVSITIDPSIIADAVKVDDEKNMSRFTSKALVFYTKHLVETTKK